MQKILQNVFFEKRGFEGLFEDNPEWGWPNSRINSKFWKVEWNNGWWIVNWLQHISVDALNYLFRLIKILFTTSLIPDVEWRIKLFPKKLKIIIIRIVRDETQVDSLIAW